MLNTPATTASPGLNAAQARSWALEAGFTEAGLVPLPYSAAERDAERFEQWIAAGTAGSMRYLERRSDKGQLLRARVETPFPWARSAIVCFALYNSTCQRSLDAAPEGTGWIARYAWSSREDASGKRVPSDYHKVLKKRLQALETHLRGQFGEFQARGFVDTGPLVERSLATAAGLGWTGKNTCLIHPKIGSYGFLAVLLASLDAVREEKSPELVPDRCGTCRRCIDACPTDALTPYRMDATRCISYLTIEHEGQINAELMPGIGRQVFGCDICQEVCPWNRKAPIAVDSDLASREELVNPSLQWLASLSEPEFEANFNGSPVRRAGFLGLRRNIAIAMGNSGLPGYVPILRDWAAADEVGLRHAARWALNKIESNPESSAESQNPSRNTTYPPAGISLKKN
jgi:epoxyqueuosine reductase